MTIPLVDGLLLTLAVGLLFAALELFRNWLEDHEI
jgi:hypothetical protein